MWKETPIPMYLQFYLFNWTNSEEVMKNQTVKPIFVEHGPYTYYEHHIRENITFNDNNTITFLTKRNWRFVPEMTVGSLDDVITTVNPIVAVSINNYVSIDITIIDCKKIPEESKLGVCNINSILILLTINTPTNVF